LTYKEPELSNNQSHTDSKLSDGDDFVPGKAISNVTSELLKALFDAASTLEMEKLSYKICIIRCNSLENVASLPIVKAITPYICSKLVYKLRILE